MDFSAPNEIVELGKAAALELCVPGATVKAEVEFGLDSSNEPAYMFYFWIRKQDLINIPRGLVSIRLAQHIVDRLLAIGDTHNPIIRRVIVSEEEPARVA